MQPDDFRVQVGLYERMGDLLRRLGEVPPGTRVLLQVPPRALALRTLDDARLLRERQAQQQLDLVIASTDAAILAQARGYGFPVEDLRVPRRGAAGGAAGPGLGQAMFRGLGQPGPAPAAEPLPRPAPPAPRPVAPVPPPAAPPVSPPVGPAPVPPPAAPPVAPSVAPPLPRDPGPAVATPDPFRGLETAGRTPDFYVEPPPALPALPTLPPFRAPAPTPLPPRTVPGDADQTTAPAPNPVAAPPPVSRPAVPAPPPTFAPSVAAPPAPPPAASAPPERPVAVPPATEPPLSTAPPPARAPMREAPVAPPIPPAPVASAASMAPAVEPSRPAPPLAPGPREANGSERAAAIPAPPPPPSHLAPVVDRAAPAAPPLAEAPAPVPPAPSPEAPPARPRFGLGALRDAITTRLSRESTAAPDADYADPVPAAPPVAPPAPPVPAGRTPVRLPPDFAIEVSRRAASAARGVEFTTALERDEPVEELLERLDLVKGGTTIRLHVPREALALQTLEEYDMLEALQERRQVRLAVVSSNPTVVGMAWLYGFEVSDLRSPRAAGAPAPLPDEYIVELNRQERTADLLRRLEGVPVAAKVEIHVPREGAALRTPEDYQLFRAARPWQPGQVRITSRDPRVIDLARIYDFDGEYTLEIGPQETTPYALKWLATLPPGAACRLRVHRDTTALRRPVDYKLLRSRQAAGQLQLTVVSRDLRVLGLATVHGLAVDNLRLRHRISVGAAPAPKGASKEAPRPAAESATPPEVAAAPPAQDTAAVAVPPPAPVQQAAPVVVPPDDTIAATPDAAPPATPDLDPDEAQICAYLRKHDSISRAQCERLLGVSRTQAKLRLQKMRDRGILRLEGTGNNIRYVLATERRRRAR